MFVGEDSGIWDKRTIMYLKFKECTKLIEREKDALDKDDWNKNDLKAINLI